MAPLTWSSCAFVLVCVAAKGGLVNLQGVAAAAAAKKSLEFPQRRRRGRLGVGGGRATSGRDRELPHHGRHPRASGHGARFRRSCRARPHPGDNGPTTAPRFGAVEDARLHPEATHGGSRVAGVRGFRYRDRRRGAARHRGRSLALGSLCPPDIRGSPTLCASAVGRSLSQLVRWWLPTSWPPCPDSVRPVRQPQHCSELSDEVVIGQ